MNSLYIFDPTKKDPLCKFRGGGRILQILKENLPQAQFIENISHLDHDREKTRKNSIFINPLFNPFQLPAILKRIAKKQIQIIFDVIPLKYPHHFPAGLKGKFNLWLNKLALKNYDKIITISNHSKKDIIQYLKIAEDKIEVVYPTLSQVFTNSKQPILTNFNQFQPISTNYCLYVGDVNWNKNLVNLAKAIKIINVTCVFVGKEFESLKVKKLESSTEKPSNLQIFQPSKLSHPWQKEFRNFLTEVSDDKRFIFLGYLDDYRLIKLYQQSWVNILVSRDEGFGFSFLEAASQGCPSVLSDIEVFHETAADAAWFADPEDPHDIANKIGEIYFNKNLRDKLGKKAYQRSRYFKKEKFKKDFLKALS